MGEVIRIDADTMPTHEARCEGQEIPFTRCGCQHIPGVYVHPLEDERELVHQCDIEVALGVLDYLGCLCHLDARGTMDTGFHDGFVDLGDDFQGRIVLPGNHLGNVSKAVLPITGVDALRRVAHSKILTAGEAGCALEFRNTILLRRARIYRGLEYHDVPVLQLRPDCL